MQKTKYKKIIGRISSQLSAFLSAIVLVGAGLIGGSVAHADTAGSITRVATAYVEEASIVEGPDGNLWSPGYRGEINKVTKSGTVTTYSISGIYPYYLSRVIRGSDGNIWFSSPSKIGKTNTSGTTIQTYGLPSGFSGSGFTTLTNGPDGNVWAFAYNSTTNSNNVLIYNTNGTFLRSYQTGNYTRNATTDYASHAVWYAQTGADGTVAPNNNDVQIVKVAMDGTRTTYNPSITGIPQGVTVGADGQIWFVVRTGTNTVVGKVTSSGSFATYSLSTPYGAYIAAGPDGNMWLTTDNNGTIERISTSGTFTSYTGLSRPSAITAGSDGNMWFQEYSTLKNSKIGTGVSSNTADVDNDGLTGNDELLQGTSDFSSDTDNDGLSDLVESSSYGSRNSLFCNSAVTTCEYPSPTKPDLYVETDWMVKPGTGGYSMKPTSTQINTVKTSYANHGITAHFDTGQLGGGNEVPYDEFMSLAVTPNVNDFYDYKYGNGDDISRNFSENRQHVYHYMLFGDYAFLRDEYGNLYTNGTGASYGGDDDSFIAYGAINDDSAHYSSLDTALSGTIIHELGHTLCLTGVKHDSLGAQIEAYDGQPLSCQFAGIDSTSVTSTNYPSSLNYTDHNQYNIVDYSKGLNGTTVDHNDWGLIRLADFATHQNDGDPEPGISVQRRGFKKVKRVKSMIQAGPTTHPHKLHK